MESRWKLAVEHKGFFLLGSRGGLTFYLRNRLRMVSPFALILLGSSHFS